MFYIQVLLLLKSICISHLPCSLRKLYANETKYKQTLSNTRNTFLKEIDK